MFQQHLLRKLPINKKTIVVDKWVVKLIVKNFLIFWNFFKQRFDDEQDAPQIPQQFLPQQKQQQQQKTVARPRN